jgi:hypothetical protein
VYLRSRYRSNWTLHKPANMVATYRQSV